MKIKEGNPHFEKTLNMVIENMLEKGVEISDIEGFKASVSYIELDETTSQISLKIKGESEVEND